MFTGGNDMLCLQQISRGKLEFFSEFLDIFTPTLGLAPFWQHVDCRFLCYSSQIDWSGPSFQNCPWGLKRKTSKNNVNFGLFS